MLIYNTLSGKKEELVPQAKPLKIFVCGPTVYDYPHIGNARTYVAFDSFARYLRFKKIKVFYLQNITDIDDRIINRAQNEKTTWKKVSAKFEKIYHENEKKLGITTIDKYAKASGYIPQIIAQIKTLIDKGHAYKIPDEGYYFDISTFKEYGKLSKRTTGAAEDASSRIDESVRKRNKGDFALWKFSANLPSDLQSKNKVSWTPQIFNGEPVWFTELGPGRPGWHIEDTAITEKFFGPQYDIHGGAIDLKFPHHEAEIAQQEAASGKAPLAKIWMHAGFLLVNGQKMSKSVGNVVTIEAILEQSSKSAFRHLILSHHYRSPIDYTAGILKQSVNTITSIEKFAAKLQFIANIDKGGSIAGGIKECVEKARQEFFAALDDDFNTPLALGAASNLINTCQEKLWQLKKAEALLVLKTLKEFFGIFGIVLAKYAPQARITALAKKRNVLRAEKKFTEADELRNNALKAGYKIEDTPIGPFIFKL